MSIDTSLRMRSSLVRHRNVLSRAERLGRLKEEERWKDGMSVLGLPKVGNRKAKASKKEKKEAAADGTTAAAAPAAGAAPAPAAAPAAKPAGKPAK